MEAICHAVEGVTLTFLVPGPFSDGSPFSDLSQFLTPSTSVQSQAIYVILGGDVVDPISPKLVYIDIAAVVAG